MKKVILIFGLFFILLGLTDKNFGQESENDIVNECIKQVIGKEKGESLISRVEKVKGQEKLEILRELKTEEILKIGDLVCKGIEGGLSDKVYFSLVAISVPMYERVNQEKDCYLWLDMIKDEKTDIKWKEILISVIICPYKNKDNLIHFMTPETKEKWISTLKEEIKKKYPPSLLDIISKTIKELESSHFKQ